MLKKLETNPRLFALDSDYKETQPQLRVDIDKARAADLACPRRRSARPWRHSSAVAASRRSRANGEEYDVIVQADIDAGASRPICAICTCAPPPRSNCIPLSNLVTLSDMAAPGQLNRFNRLRAITLSARWRRVFARRCAGFDRAGRARGAAGAWRRPT
jgi:multidrug efflux pump